MRFWSFSLPFVKITIKIIPKHWSEVRIYQISCCVHYKLQCKHVKVSNYPTASYAFGIFYILCTLHVYFVKRAPVKRQCKKSCELHLLFCEPKVCSQCIRLKVRPISVAFWLNRFWWSQRSKPPPCSALEQPFFVKRNSDSFMVKSHFIALFWTYWAN